jgi:ectoine hydroxylase-related dioxygenase (phytanoyl-CoA dioxygenase family)
MGNELLSEKARGLSNATFKFDETSNYCFAIANFYPGVSKMITPQERYMFDVQGYIVIKNVLDAETVESMRQDMAKAGVAHAPDRPGATNFGDFLKWGPAWRDLIDQARIYPFLLELLGDKFRLDHAYGMAMRATGKPAPEGNEMHHEADMYSYGCYYLNNGRQMHNGLIVVSYALTDIQENAGGFICIPGSHKASVPMPPEFHSMKNNPMWKQVPQKAGDVLIFTESLTHGTMPWTSTTGERRSVLLKYCPGYMQWSVGVKAAEIEGLTERQTKILAPALVHQRPAL